MYAVSSRLFIIKKPSRFSSVVMLARMVVLNDSHHMCHYLKGMHQKPPMPVRDTSVPPIHVGGLGLIYLRWVVVSARESMRCRNSVRSAWTGTGADSAIRRPWAVPSA